MKLNKFAFGTLVSGSLGVCGALPAFAQDSGPVLDEIIVSAQKREQSLQDVPISLVAISAKQIEMKGIQRLDELSGLVPNFSVQQDPIGDKINIRGVQSGNNAGLEQSVSTFVDGVYRGRGTQSRFSFLDPGRIEVLRGPQGTLFGKNTIGGAINITTGKPTHELDAALSTTYTFDNVEEYEVRGHVAGPISENMRGRLAGLYHNLDEGWVENLYYDQFEPTVEEYALRGTIEYDVSDVTMLTAKIEVGNWDQVGQPFSTLTAGPLVLFGIEDKNYDTANIGSRNSVLNVGSAGTFNGKNAEGVLTLTHELDSGVITAIGAYSEYDFLRECDCDFSIADIVRFDDEEDFSQYSAELRYASNTGKDIDYIVGGYFQYNELLARGDTQFNVRGDVGELAIDTLLNVGCQGAIAAGVDPATNRNCILNGLITGFDGTPLAYTDFGRLHTLDQENTVYAIFGQATWNATDRLSATLGLRYTIEDKTATQSTIATDYGTRTRNDFFGTASLWGAFGAPDPFSAVGEAQIHSNDLGRDEKSFTWSADVQYKATENANLYAKIATGFKAGGFNSFALGADPAEAEYEEEEVLSGELGGKFKLLDGAAELNVALFYSEFEDLQTALFTGSTSFIVQNASEAVTQGIELDGRWAVSDTAQLHGSLAYVDFEFKNFPNAGCTVDQLLAFRTDASDPLATLQTCAAAEINDLSGRTSENTPEISATIGYTNHWDIGDSLRVHFATDIVYASSQFRQADLDLAIKDDAFTKVNAVIGLGALDGRWKVDLIAKNITNERTFSYGNDTPLIDTARQFAPDRPRTIAIRLSLRN